MAEISYPSNSPDLAIFDYHPIHKGPWVFFLPAPEILSWLPILWNQPPQQAQHPQQPTPKKWVEYPTSHRNHPGTEKKEPGSKPSLKMAFRFLTELFILYLFFGGVMGGDICIHIYIYIYLYTTYPRNLTNGCPK